MKISKRNLNRLIESLLRESELEMSFKEKAFEEINSLTQGDKDLLDNYLESINPNLNVSKIFIDKNREVEIPLEEKEVVMLDELISELSEFIKTYLGSNEEHITGYIKEITPVVEYSDGAMVKSWFKDGQLHREGDKPAEIEYYKDGSIRVVRCYKDGEFHREGDKPAVISYYEDGSIYTELWFKDGKCHREGDKPAWIWYREDGSTYEERWYKDGELHREGGKPAFVWYRKDGSILRKRWFEDGVEYILGEES